ncbi:branched-chain amino acid ABC transporter permease [Pusillimonas noertemannii]|uniref:Amino acid/amide ABC transporter membrane protein 2 (HAAT family) n=1 Tax=Pusillimonas noertemannii TaxID=305977 RepID=A0A2U1CRA1_9BURK|nr:branched-chain amino acid ABC transporter permease [Pusillimonas noertemannii]NYT67756.1 branched-chain amino acid ABC transporter permease [Pusillimonas noertemannii]PVY68427.1 amino acid/amide ABC transporter membrane protein 2 (HAAT family) [Pusillimonas noertemannii]TFL12092.1 branched-chain amino acid ABC transporter permease [Pusillimonas noertemannii]
MRFILRAVLLLVLLALVLSLPSFASSYYLGLVIKIMIYALFALSLQLLVGCTGLVSLGHSAFFGIAAYFVTLLSPESGAGNMLWLLPGAMLAAMGYAVVTGALALRTKGIYFIMVTLAFAQMAYYVFHDTALGGGTDGIYLYFRPEIRLGDWVVLNIDNQFVFYVFTLACLLLTWAFLALLMRSRFGAALTGIRVNEQRMRAAGFSTFKYKLIAYVIGCGLAGVAGFLYAAKDGYVNPELLAWEQSGLVLLMVILGGMGRLWGAVLGAVALTLLQELFQSHALFGEFASRWHLTFGLAIIALVAVLPQGLAGLPEQLRNRRRSKSISPASAQ